MPMTSRERVLAAFAHEETDAVPAWCGASPEFWAKAKTALSLDDEGLRRRLGDDFRRLTAPWRDPGPPLAAGSTWRSPFGVERSGIGYGQPLSHPFAGTRLPNARYWTIPGRIARTSTSLPSGPRPLPGAANTLSSVATGRPSGTTR